MGDNRIVMKRANMKKYINSSQTDLTSYKIDRIYIVDNAIDATLDNLYIAENSDDDIYMEYDDSELLGISIEEIHSIEKEEVLDRIYDLFLAGDFDRQPLTEQQCRKLWAWYKFGNPKDIVTDINSIIQAIKSAIVTNKPYDRTSPDEQWEKYAETKDLDLNLDDVLILLMQMTSEQFRGEIMIENAEYIVSRLLEFHLTGPYIIHDGTVIPEVRIYIKIEKQIKDGHIALISFHTNYPPNLKGN